MIRSKRFALQILAAVVAVSTINASTEIICEGEYDGHLQGIAIDGKESIFWSFTVALVKTDFKGKQVASIPVPNHHGDLCYSEGMLYVAVNLGAFNEPAGKADSWLYAYDAEDLSLVWKRSLPEVVHGAGGIDRHGDHFYVVGGLPPGIDENYIYKYKSDGEFVKRIAVASGYTVMGIQTAFFTDGFWWFGCYGEPRTLIKADADFRFVGRRLFDASLGIEKTTGGDFLIGKDLRLPSGGHRGSIVLAQENTESFLRVLSVE
ncbi:MAG: hypothetical protein P8L44_12790 [Opitutales bacterium]|jgi:hypothetical protein|nr:hypothetical protein [Opitutales bacterium]